MGVMDHQLGVVSEASYGISATPTRFFEYNDANINESEGRTEGTGLRVGTYVAREDRFTPYFAGAAGTIQMDVLTKGFGFWLEHMLGSVATTGAGPYTHTATVGDLYGLSFCAQVNRPFHPSGTNQAFLYEGGKVASWTLSNSVDGNLVLDLECDFQDVDTTTALATAAYPTAMEPLSWAGGVIEVGGVAVDVTEFSVSCNNGLDVDRRFIRANTLKKEPTGGRREVEFSLSADFESMDLRDYVHSTTRAGALASLTGTWTNGTSSLSVSIPSVRFDSWEGAAGGPEAISQSLSGVGRYNGTDSPISLVYVTADATP